MKPLLVMLSAAAVMYSIRSAATEVVHPRSETAFKLESECGELREKVDRQYRREHDWVASVTVTSRYSPAANQCLVRIQAGTIFDTDEDNLYDAQTMVVLAYASRTIDTDFSSRNPFPPYYASMIGSGRGADWAAWNNAKAFIEHAMQREN
jgi:hypothetical protein